MKITLPPDQEHKDKRLLAFHEAGHCAIAEHFGWEWRGHIERVGNATFENKAFEGYVRFHPRFAMTEERAQPFKRAVVGWGGIIAEYLHDAPEEERTAALDGFGLFWDLNCQELDPACSQTDRQAVNGHPQRWRTAKTAWRIIVSKWQFVERIANILIKEGQACDWQTNNTKGWRLLERSKRAARKSAAA